MVMVMVMGMGVRERESRGNPKRGERKVGTLHKWRHMSGQRGTGGHSQRV